MKREIDWVTVELWFKDELKELMRAERALDPDEERNPYTFRIFDIQEIVGSIEQGDLNHAYDVIVEEYGEEFFEDFLL